jgi:lysylphosphatidylglycerol synthetase-like protein (DUF2156 family)
VSLGVAPRTIGTTDVAGAMDRALRAMYWGLDRFQRSDTLRRFKTKFGPRWEDRYLVVPSPASLPEVIVALIRVHLPPLPWTAAWLGSVVKSAVRPESGRRVWA